MKLEDQVCSLELAKKLKELEVKQGSLFYWYGYSEKDNCASIVYTKGKIIDNDHCSAFTVAELGEMLPKVLEFIEYQPYYYIQRLTTDKQWFIEYRDAFNYCSENMQKVFYDENEANNRAKMLIHLIENSIMELPL